MVGTSPAMTCGVVGGWRQGPLESNGGCDLETVRRSKRLQGMLFSESDHRLSRPRALWGRVILHSTLVVCLAIAGLALVG